MEITVGAADAARAEEEHEERVLVFRGERFELPDDPAWEVVDAIRASNWHVAIVALLGTAEGERLWGMKPTVSEIEALDEGLAKAYFGLGGRPGESRASRSSSKKGSKSSRPSGKRATA